MEHKKIERNNYNINIIKTDRFKSIDLTVFFTNEFNKDSAIKGHLLPTMLVSSSKKYKNYGDTTIRGEELYGASLSSNFVNVGDTVRLRISIDFLDPKYTEPEMFKKSLEFLKECLLNPNIEGEGFNKHIFETNKNSIINNLNNINDNMDAYLSIKFDNKMYGDTSASFDLYNERDKFIKLTPKEGYEFYLEILKTWKMGIYLTGNIDESTEEKYIKEIDKIFSSINNNFDKNKKLNLYTGDLKINFEEVVESSKFSQSGVAIGYAFNNLTEYEKRYIIYIYNGIFGGMTNSLLFKNVREKHSLCYSVHSYINKYPPTITVRSKISKENYDKTILEINKTLLKMKKRRYVKSSLKTVKENINTSINSTYDDMAGIVLTYYYKNLDPDDYVELEELRKNYMKVKVKDVIKLNDKISKSIIYFLRGDKE